MNETTAPTAKHFTSSGYLTIKLPSGASFTFKGTSLIELSEHASELQHRIDRDTRYLAALQMYFDGETVMDPAALR